MSFLTLRSVAVSDGRVNLASGVSAVGEADAFARGELEVCLQKVRSQGLGSRWLSSSVGQLLGASQDAGRSGGINTVSTTNRLPFVPRAPLMKATPFTVGNLPPVAFKFKTEPSSVVT